ncbi:MAG: metalloregulator ArsR/SmtB family transcription factor [Pseudomonadota bacterium]
MPETLEARTDLGERLAPLIHGPEAVAAVDPLDIDRFAAVCKALGHAARATIVQHLLARNTCICGELVDLLPLAQSTVSQHLRQLKACGLIQGEIKGPRTCYCLDMHLLARFKRTVAAMKG